MNETVSASPGSPARWRWATYLCVGATASLFVLQVIAYFEVGYWPDLDVVGPDPGTLQYPPAVFQLLVDILQVLAALSPVLALVYWIARRLSVFLKLGGRFEIDMASLIIFLISWILWAGYFFVGPGGPGVWLLD